MHVPEVKLLAVITDVKMHAEVLGQLQNLEKSKILGLFWPPVVNAQTPFWLAIGK